MTRRVGLVTGGASGIGRATAHSLAKAGHDVVIVDLNLEAARKVAAEVEAMGAAALAIEGNVAAEETAQKAIQLTEAQFGRLDVLVACAGIDLHKLLGDIEVADWQRVMDINVTGSFLFMKHASRLMVAQKYGRIVLLGSSSGIYGMGWPAYSAAKAALQGLALSAARELALSGVTVNVVAPGPTETPLSVGLWANNPGRRERLESSVPVGRVAQAEEIASAITYLAGENSGFVTGSTLVIDGGLTSLMRVQTQ
jgi:NAD(P)-dependent dehydrogenase (short-subunit alcohol dehydrogenase family)